MEQLKEKCRILRILSRSEDFYEENDIYVILSTLSCNVARSPCSSLLITALEKLRLAAGITRNSEEPNLILVSHLNDVPVTSNNYVHWNNPVFSESTAVKIESVIEIFDKRYRNLNPFRKIDDSKLLTLFGPRQEIMSFKNPGHEIYHDEMKTAIESILISSTPKFSDFKWLVYAGIRSQNCEHCLSYMLNPLSSVKRVQKLVRTLTRGVWSPRADMDMELTSEWLDDDNKKISLGCWRLAPDAEFPISSKASPPSSENQSSPLDFIKIRQSRHLENLKNVMLMIDKKIQLLINCDNMVEKEKEEKELKSQRIRLGIIFMELQNSQMDVSEFGFSTGNSVLDIGLEAAVTKMLSNSKFEFNAARILTNMDMNTFKLYCEVKNVSFIEKEIIDKITEKLKLLVEASNVIVHAPEVSNRRAENEKECSDADIFEDLHDFNADFIEISDSAASPKPKKQKTGEVTMKDKLKKIKTTEQKGLLAEAYAEALLLMNEINSSHLPLTRATASDEFCAFCGVFIYDPSPNLSCGFHDDYQQIVNLDIKEMLVRRKFAKSISGKTLNVLKKYMHQQKNNWQNAKVKNTMPTLSKLRPVRNKSNAETVRGESPPKNIRNITQKMQKAKTPALKKRRPRKESSSSEEEYRRKSEEDRIRDTFLDLPPNFDELLVEPCCSSRRVNIFMSMPEFEEYRILKSPPTQVVSDNNPRSVLITKDPNIWFQIRDNPRQVKKRKPYSGKRRRKRPKKVQKQSEMEIEIDDQDVPELMAKLEKETAATSSRLQHFNDSHEEEEVRMEDVLDD